MKKISPQVELDMEYIQLCRLPLDQLQRFKEWTNKLHTFTIKDGFGEMHECVPYDIYDFWFDTLKEEKEESDLAIF